MNAHDVLKYGHHTFLNALERIPRDRWDEGGVCGVWSTKELAAHLASYEGLLVDVLTKIAGQELPTPILDDFLREKEAFNDIQVEHRASLDANAVVAQYKDAHNAVWRIAAALPPEKFTETGTLPWYGDEYSLDDFIVYQYYGHKREHAAQLALFYDRLS